MDSSRGFIKVKGSPVWPRSSISVPGSTISYPYLLQPKEQRQHISPSYMNGSIHDASLPNVNWWKTYEEIQPSLDNASDYRTRINESPTASQVPITKLHHVYDNSRPQTSNIYTGVIRNNRFDFITEEPHKKRLKKTSDSNIGAILNQHVVESASPSHHDPAIKSACNGSQEHVELCSVSQSEVGQPNMSTTDCLSVAADSNYSAPEYSKLQYSWAGQPHEKPCFESLSSLETYMIEHPSTESASVLPSISSFTTPFDQYGYRGMTCFPLMYPAALPPYLQYYPMFPDSYCLLRERYKDVEPYMFPTFIQPKPFSSSFPYRPIPETPPPSSLAYPNPAAMFQAANLVPPFTSRPSLAETSTRVPSSKADDSRGYNNHKIQPRPLSQANWLKAENGYNYTVAAAPSDVMTYLPQSVSHPNDIDTVSSTTTSTSSDDDDDDDEDEKPRISISSLVGKKKSLPSRKPHVCDICGKTYARAFTLKTHKRVHTGERPFSCKICFKTFTQGSGLDSHMRVHTGEKPYECPVCARAFSHSSAVKSHLRRHTGEKPFRCNMCNKTFGDQSTLTKHKRVHTGEKPFKCHICELTFTQIGNMNKHLRTIHGNNHNRSYSAMANKQTTTNH